MQKYITNANRLKLFRGVAFFVGIIGLFWNLKMLFDTSLNLSGQGISIWYLGVITVFGLLLFPILSIILFSPLISYYALKEEDNFFRMTFKFFGGFLGAFLISSFGITSWFIVIVFIYSLFQ